MFRIGEYTENLKIRQILIGVTQLDFWGTRHSGEIGNPVLELVKNFCLRLALPPSGLRLSPERRECNSKCITSILIQTFAF